MTNRRNFPKAAIAAAVLAALGIFYFCFNPAHTWWMPRCLFHQATGLLCPGCGSQRAIHSLLHLRLAEAFSFNPLVPVALVYVFLLAVLGSIPNFSVAKSLGERTKRRLSRLHSALTSLPAILAWLVAIVVWWIARNFP